MSENDKHVFTTEQKAKLVVTVLVILVIAALSLARLLQPEFKVDLIVYAILGGILFGVGGIRELLGSIQITPPQNKPEDNKPTKKRKRR